MVRKMMIGAAVVGATLLAMPSSATYAGGMDEMSSQAGTKGVGATQGGTGPGTNAGDPGITNSTGPGANPITPAPTKQRHVRRHHRSTVGSSTNMKQ